MVARIYKPSKTAMQAGKAQTVRWLLEFVSETPREVDPLMGWTSSRDTRQQVRLSFDTKEEAIAHAKRIGIAYQVVEEQPRKVGPMAYADNFKYGRIGFWTH